MKFPEKVFCIFDGAEKSDILTPLDVTTEITRSADGCMIYASEKGSGRVAVYVLSEMPQIPKTPTPYKKEKADESN